MTTHDRDKVIAAAKESGCLHAQRDEWYRVYDNQLEAIYAIAYEAGCVSRDAEIESLRQQLETRNEQYENLLNISALRETEQQEKLADHIKREVMLRDVIDKAATQIKRCDYTPARSALLQAIAATADLDGLILCEKELCRDDGRCQYAIDNGAEGLGHCPEGKCCMPLYRAWEPKK